jgi:transposase
VTELLPWADPASRFTRAFEDAVAWMAQRMDQTSVCSLMAIAWRTVGSIAARVVARLGPTDRLDGLTHIGIDELSYRRHHKYLTIVTDHVRGRVVWVGEGRSAATIGSFFDELGPERAARLRVVTLDMCEAYIGVAKKRAPQAQIVFDRFHVQRLAQDALDAVRRAQVRELKGTRDGKEIKKTRFALQKRPWRLTVEEGEKLAAIRRSNQPLYRAYLLKESLALVFDEPDLGVAREKLRQWMSWAGRSRLAPFRKVAKTLRRHQEGVLAYVATGLSNGRSEGLNGKVRTITRRAYGFHEASSLIGFIFLCCAGLTLDAPERRRRLARL